MGSGQRTKHSWASALWLVASQGWRQLAAVQILPPFPGVETQGQVTLRALEAVRVTPLPYPLRLTAAATEDPAEGCLGSSPGLLPRTRVFRGTPPSCIIMISSYELSSAKASSRGSTGKSLWVLERSQGARTLSPPWMRVGQKEPEPRA